MENNFISKWKKGIEEITPYQQLRIQLISQSIMVFGIILGLLFNKIFWLNLILFGALVNQLIMMLPLFKKYHILKNLEEV